MDLVRDLLDKQIVDRRHRNVGRVDTIVMELSAGRPPRVVGIEVGASALERRIHPRFGERVGRWLGRRDPTLGRPVRIPIAEVEWENGVWVKWVTGDEASPAFRWELWWRDHVVRHVPGTRP